MSKKNWSNFILMVVAVALAALVSNYNYINNQSYKITKTELYKIDSINTMVTEIVNHRGKYILFEDFERRKYIISETESKIIGNRGNIFRNANLVFDIMTDKEGLRVYNEKNTIEKISVYDVVVNGKSLISIDEVNNLRYKQATSTYFYILGICGIVIPFLLWKKRNTAE